MTFILSFVFICLILDFIFFDTFNEKRIGDLEDKIKDLEKKHKYD